MKLIVAFCSFVALPVRIMQFVMDLCFVENGFLEVCA